jgi:hypothetical protein
MTRYVHCYGYKAPEADAGVLKLAQGRLPNGGLYVDFQDVSATRALVKSHLEEIGETYSQNWCYDRSRLEDDQFVFIKGVCTVPADLTCDLGYGDEKIQIETVGILVSGQWDGGDNGFYASIITQTNFTASKNYQRPREHDLVREYPCHHVPLPAGW